MPSRRVLVKSFNVTVEKISPGSTHRFRGASSEIPPVQVTLML